MAFTNSGFISINQFDTWANILELAKSNPTIKEKIDELLVLYELSVERKSQENGDSELWSISYSAIDNTWKYKL